MDTIRIGVVGIGHLGTYHLQKYHMLPHCRIAAVADTLEERARGAADTYRCRAYTDYRAMQDEVDAVSITVPTEHHHAVARDFLARGIDVFLEKPIAKTLAEADDLIALAESRSAILQVGLIERFNPAVTALGHVITRPLFIESHRLHPFFSRGTDVDVILDLMIHDLDIIISCVQSPVSGVDAVGVSVLSDKVDIANARVTFESGCVANITASRISNKKMQKIRFFDMNGYHSVDYAKRELLSLRRSITPAGATEITENDVAVEPCDPLEEEIRAFAGSVMTRTQPLVSGREARKSLDLALLILERIHTAQENIRHDTDG